MSLNAKVTLFSLVVLVSIGVYGSVRVYRHLHPDLPPPPPPRPETTLTIVPGWNVRQVAAYLVKQGFASSTEDVYAVTGQPAVERNRREGPPYPDAMAGLELVSRKEPTVSYEGYLAPETYRVFRSATVQEVVAKLLKEREKEMEEIFPGGKEAAVAPLGEKMANVTVHDVVTMASIIEKETRHDVDRGLVADILWRRYLKGWALQVDSSVHYVVDRTGDVFTTEDERAIDSPWNTYKYPGLPPGPICNPSIESLTAALRPTANTYWYFLSGSDGQMHYAKTLEEHAANRAKYL